MGIRVVTDESDGWSSRPSARPFVRCINADRNTVVVGSRVAICCGH